MFRGEADRILKANNATEQTQFPRYALKRENMGIPYQVTSLLPGRIKLKSEFFKHIPVSEEAIKYFISNQHGLSRIAVNKHMGCITLEYEAPLFNPGVLLNFLDATTPEVLALVLSQLQSIESQHCDHEEDGSNSKRWLALNTLGFLPFLFKSTLPTGFFTALILGLATPVLKKAVEAVKRKKIDVHFLDSSAIVLSTLLKSPFSSMLMIWLLSLGDVIEDKTRGSASREIEKLLHFNDETAWLYHHDGKITQVAVPEIKNGDKVVVYTGEKIAIDGVVIDGEAMVNQTSLTGESNPVHKKLKDKVYAGTFVEDGKLYILTEKVGNETVLAQIVRIIQESAKKPIEMQKSAEQQANKFVMPTFLTAASIYAMTGNLSRTVSTLTFDYHTGVHVSTPTSIMAHMALAARKGILFKSGRHIEILHHVDTIVFDKTGTLTVGHPKITQIISYEMSAEKALQHAASLEQRVSHPVAKSIVEKAEKNKLKIMPRKESKYHMGLGMEAELNGNKFLIGSSKFMEKLKIKISKKIKKDVDAFHERGESVLYLVDNNAIVALIGFSDPLRVESKAVVNLLHQLGREVILCTGDNADAAKVVANKLNIKKYHARVFPDEKAKIIEALKGQGKTVAFLGDGVNDSPALSVADIGISITSGADIAVEVADVVIGSDLRNLIEAIVISDLAIANMKQNYRINTFANTFGILGSIAGLFPPVVATMINNGTTIFMGMNAVRPLWKKIDSSHLTSLTV